MDVPLSFTWDHALYAAVVAVAGVVLDIRRRRGQDPLLTKLGLIYGYLNGSGIMGKLKGIEAWQESHKKDDEDRHAELTGKLETMADTFGRRLAAIEKAAKEAADRIAAVEKAQKAAP